jgi:metacaspase-1
MKKTLMVGINAYPSSPLNGCLNDIRLMYKILKDIYGYTDFQVLDDKRATKKNILKGLQWLCASAKKGDELVVDYSGHGTQVPCTTKTAGFEIDNLDECLVPYDMDWDDPLRDDDLHQFIMNLPKGVKILFIADCCFSGTLLRNGALPPKVKNRYMPPPLSSVLTGDINLDDDLCMVSSSNKSRGLKSDPRKSMQKLPFIVRSTDQGDAILISGCSDKQTSADAYINGRYHGALTFYLAQALKEADWNISYQDLVIRVNQKLDREDYEQDPQLEGREEYLDKLFLGGIKK